MEFNERGNSNCLSDVMCPLCGSHGPFWINAQANFLVYDEGTTEFSDLEWESETAFTFCPICKHSGRLSLFSEGLRIYLVSLHEDPDDTFILNFQCYAEDPDHADEQALAAYPNADLINCVLKWEIE